MRRPPQRTSLAGFSLVELMVAITIALAASLAIFQTYASSEERKRTTTSGSEGLQAGVFALASLQRSIINAGYNLGVISDAGYTSPVRQITPGGVYTLSTTNPPTPEFHIGCTATIGGQPVRVAPLIATDGGNGIASDTLLIFSGNSANVPLPIGTETGGVAAGVATVRLRSTFGFAVGDWVLVYEQSAVINAGTARPRACTFARVTALPNAPTFSPADIVLSVPTAAAYDTPMVINMGPNPTLESWTVDANGRLTVTDLINNTPAQVIAENVVSMQVQLGIDVGNDDVVDEWINPPAAAGTWLNPPNPMPENQITAALPVPGGARSLNQVKAVRVGLLVRSPQVERPDDAGNCTTTPAGPAQVLPAVAGALANRLPDMPSSGNYMLAGDQRCFRYNTVTSQIPVRNVVLSEM